MPTPLKSAVIEDFRANFLGDLIQPGNPTYDDSRRI